MTTILVVEDEALIAGDIQRTLIKLGYDVPLTVGTGEAAIEATGRLHPGLVLMDIKLRGQMDGIDAAQEIRARFTSPVVYLTSHSDDATLSRAMETHPSGYLLKPFNDRELRTAIEVALHKHELESRLAARERWFATTLRSIGDAVIATDQNEIITFMNAVAEKITGWGEEAIGRPFAEVFCLVDKSGVPIASPIRLALETSFAVALPDNTGLVSKTGQQIAVDDSASAITDDKGNVLGVVVFRDISDRRKLEERLAHTERLASLGTMAAGMAHEINNPLAFVLSNVEITREGLVAFAETLRGLQVAEGQSPTVDHLMAQVAEFGEALSDVQEGAERVRKIVHDLKKFARAGRASSQALLDLPDVLETAIKMTDHSVRHHARVRRCFGTTPFVEADDGPLGQVFTNLLINAAQAIGDGRAETSEIVVTSYTDAAGQAVVEVRDSGPGIRSDVLPKIFDPFFTTKPVGSGMGLGLAICHSIITAIGGQLVAENAPGGGALFRVTIPAARRAAAAPSAVTPSAATPSAATPSAATPASAPARRGRVLVIDDEPQVALAVARILRGQHDVTVLNDAREALARIAAGDAYDVVFCDLMMPTTSGIDFLESLAVANPEQAKRVVFMTGGAFSARSQEFLASTSNVHLTKPCSVDAFRSVANDYVK